MNDGLYRLINSTRAVISLIGIGCLTALGIYGMTHGLTDVSGIALAIAGIAGAHSGANAYENSRTGVAHSVLPTSSPQSTPKPDNPD
jgi:hypothetical protein